ncbi:MAG: four helix bundle protein [Cyanobacteria bacterium J06642_9]
MQTFIYSFQDLQVYQLAFRCSVEVYDLAKQFPETPDACLTHQLLATSRAVRAHIAAAWGKRRDPVALISQLSTAQLAAAVMQSWIEAAIGAGYLDAEVGQDLYDRYRCIFLALDQLMENGAVVSKRWEECRDLRATA